MLIETPSVLFIHGLQGHPKKTWQQVVKAKAIRTASPSPTRHIRKEGILHSLLTSISRSRGARLDVQAGSSHATQAVDDQATGLFWPQTLLSVDIPGVRIFTYGYAPILWVAFEKVRERTACRSMRMI